MAFRILKSLLNALPTTPVSRTILTSNGGTQQRAFGASIQPIAHFPQVKYSTSPPSVFSQDQLAMANTSSFRSLYQYQPQRNFHILTGLVKSIIPVQGTNLLSNQIRTIIKFSMRKGRRKTVRAVVCRFYRLDWGIWIHPKSGRFKKLWKKGKNRRKRLRQHVFTNAWQTRTLERMTTKYWHKKKYWVDDPYESYHTRDNFRITKNTKNIVHQLD